MQGFFQYAQEILSLDTWISNTNNPYKYFKFEGLFRTMFVNF